MALLYQNRPIKSISYKYILVHENLWVLVQVLLILLINICYIDCSYKLWKMVSIRLQSNFTTHYLKYCIELMLGNIRHSPNIFLQFICHMWIIDIINVLFHNASWVKITWTHFQENYCFGCRF